MIRVRGPAEIMKAENEDRFEAYFANKKKSGGGDIAGIEFRSTDDIAERRGHRLIGKDIEVELLIPSRSTKTTLSEKSNIIKEGRLTEYRNLDWRQKGVKQRNKNKAGGGDIEQRYTDDEDEDIIYIQYKDESVAQAVARREHTIEGHTLEVTLNTGLVSPPSYQNKLLIKGLNPKTTLDVLALYIESKTKLCLLKDQLTYHIDNKDTILVTVNGEIDIQKLQDACKKAPLDGSSLNIRQVPVSNTVLVSNISEIVTEDMITLYFENLQRSNGGPVEKVAMFVNQNYCLVHFVDYNSK
ncbi:hypothetical protein DPMN_066561 [Dreissena polymorpha]|uniref:Uncharacterized protein n=1 Tax=Dreissena polymorpha TaxID=45954 RepID=A0A9D4BSX2_DREPO|nr:hypothetical protein DPMN_066561 [Dreissena polymorpha]